MLESPQLDRQKVLTILESKTQLVNQFAPQIVNAFGDFYDSLNEEQRTELRVHIDKFAEHGKHHRDYH